MALLARRQKALAGYSDYDEKWVKAQLNAGNQFTYYGGKPLDAASEKIRVVEVATAVEVPIIMAQRHKFLPNIQNVIYS